MKLLIPILLVLLTNLCLASPTALVAAKNGTELFAAVEEPAMLMSIDPDTGKINAKHTLPAAPTGMALSPDGKLLYITAGLAPGRLLTVDAADGRILADTPAGHSPCSPVVSNDGSRIFICNRFADEVIVINPKGGKIVGSFPALREPNAAVLRKDGAALFVANHLPAGAANTGDIGCALTIIDVDSGSTQHVRLPNGSTGVEGIGISPNGDHVYMTHTLARYGLPTTQVDRGWMNTSAVSVIDTKTFKLQASVLLDNIDLGAANPWGVECSPDGSMLFIAHAGTHELSIIDRAAMHERIDRAARGEKVTEVSDSAEDIANDLSFLVGIRERRKISGKGPRAIAVLGGRHCAVGAYFSGTVHLVGTDSMHGEITDILLAKPDPKDLARLGEFYYHDATRCFQHWQSCATCHPGGARTDALNWDLLNDGIGNPKQAKSMLRAIQTPPAMISGIRADAETAIRAGMRHIHFAQVMEDEAKAMEEYIKTLKPIPSPALVDGKLSTSAKRGKAVFEKAGCVHCHSGPDYTDKKMHNVDTGTGRERGIQWDTPTLVEVWRSAPYLHDGRAPDLKTLFTEHNPGNRHGHTSSLSEQEMDDLVEYLKSL